MATTSKPMRKNLKEAATHNRNKPTDKPKGVLKAEKSELSNYMRKEKMGKKEKTFASSSRPKGNKHSK